MTATPKLILEQPKLIQTGQLYTYQTSHLYFIMCLSCVVISLNSTTPHDPQVYIKMK